MKSALRKILLSLMCVVMLLVLCSCDSTELNTVMTLDAAFSGTRVISFDIKKSDLGNALTNWITNPPTVDELVASLDKNCPDELDMTVTKNGNDAHCSFTLAFSSKQEYEQKVSALLGKTVTVSYEAPSDDIYMSGFKLKEDFTSVDLMKWASDALAKEYPKFADKLDISEAKHKTTVSFSGVNYSFDNKKINIIKTYTPLSSVVVRTSRYGDNDYVRSVTLNISADNLKKIGKDNLTAYLAPLTENISEICTAEWNSENTAYVISMKQGRFDDLLRFTQAVLPGSTVEYKNDERNEPFCESGTLTETLVFDGKYYACHEDKTANVKLVYSTNDATSFSSGSTGTLSGDGKTCTLSTDNCNELSSTVISETRYVPESIDVGTSVSLFGKMTVSIVVNFPAQSSCSASERACAYFAEELDGKAVDVSVRKSSTAVTVDIDGDEEPSSEAYALVFSVSGSPEAVTEAMNDFLGGDNTLDVDTSGYMKLNLTYDVHHNIDLTRLVELSQYNGNINYTFTASGAKAQEAGWKSDNGDSNNDLLGGEIVEKTFTASSITGPSFSIEYKYSKINVLFVIGAAAIGIAVIMLLMTIANKINKKIRAKKLRKKDDVVYEAVKSVALVAIPEERRSQAIDIPRELTQRPTVVLEPRNDDGLDEDDDEPEGVQLFTSVLRLLTITVGVLFFLPLYSFTKTSGFDKGATLSCWELFRGKEIFGTQLEPYTIAIALLIIPVLSLILLFARRSLPKMIIPVYITASSLASVFLIYQMKDIITARVDAIKSSVGYITTPVAEMGYTYSIVIYVLLGLGGVLLLFSDFSYVLSQKRKKAGL